MIRAFMEALERLKRKMGFGAKKQPQSLELPPKRRRRRKHGR